MFSKQFNYFDNTRNDINGYSRIDENKIMSEILTLINTNNNNDIIDQANNFVTKVRKKRISGLGLDAFFMQYDLSSEEGIALMCLAEAMLRIPDKHNIDTLIKDKLTDMSWKQYLNGSDSTFVNAATWGLLVTGKLYADSKKHHSTIKLLKNMVAKMGEPVVRVAVKQAMSILGEQFILGTSIETAIKRSKKTYNENYLYSYDMLGEEAKTSDHAESYFNDYVNAISALKSDDVADIMKNPGISIKLSALYPRYESSHYVNATNAITARLKKLVLHAKASNITVTLDAEEAERLEMSLDIFTKVFADEKINSWGGFGLAVQAYQKRAVKVIEYLTDLAKKNNTRILVRLVKGAYWDTEIKQTQIMGYNDYPVFTRKFNTDISYIAAATKIAAAENLLYGQFATHNAHTVAYISALYAERRDFEFQCLHGMGRSLYDIVLDETHDISCRVYAPVGSHEELLPYLVRRLLENGANTSFVNRIIDKNISLERIIQDPVKQFKLCDSAYHPNIPLPRNLYAKQRLNSIGYDFSNPLVLKQLANDMDKAFDITFDVKPLLGGEFKDFTKLKKIPIINPSYDDEIIGHYHEVNASAVEHALKVADNAKYSWQQTSIYDRVNILLQAADILEQQAPLFIALAIKEAGKLWQDGVDEIREAVDFLRYYAYSAKTSLQPEELPGPTGEFNQLSYVGRGLIFCISPWNFPLAIFCGQLAAAVVSGNTVIAKPASQTVLIATKFIEILYQVGLPKDVVQILPGSSKVAGETIVKDSRVNAVMLTGSNSTSRAISQALASRDGAIVPLIAETGGMNAMIVDSSALTEQVVTDVIDSAFRSAGQRCSALRVLFLQDDIADKTIEMLVGATKELIIGDPTLLSTDVGPIIDQRSHDFLTDHQDYLQQKSAKLIYQCEKLPQHDNGSFFLPCIYEIDSINCLQNEVFGPILHIVRYKTKDLDKVIDSINSTGFGLTFGVHTRIDSVADYIKSRIKSGNIYVNRNVIGAVVGVQPFGGEGLSGTGPKAGGPNYLKRLCLERTLTINTAAVGGNTSLMTLEDPVLGE